jgi:hypothetical protein
VGFQGITNLRFYEETEPPLKAMGEHGWILHGIAEQWAGKQPEDQGDIRKRIAMPVQTSVCPVLWTNHAGIALNDSPMATTRFCHQLHSNVSQCKCTFVVGSIGGKADDPTGFENLKCEIRSLDIATFNYYNNIYRFRH